MFTLRLILAAGCLSTLISGAPLPHSLLSVAKHASRHLVERATANTYTVFGGTGDLTDGWPAQSSWISSFDDMFESNQGVMKASCTQWSVPENTDAEIAQIKSAIQTVAQSSGVDARYILAIVMQESNGCIRAPTTNYGVRNPGLMQSHNGEGTCNDATVQNPCPESEILQMIQDGTVGTSSGDGLVGCIKQSGASDVSKYYKAARIYNSGSIDGSKNLGAGIATHCYASDIANRLTGWYSGTSACDATTIAIFAGVQTSAEPETVDTAEPVSSPTTAAGGVFIQQPAPTSTSALPSTTTIAIAEVPTPEPTTTQEEPVIVSTPAPPAVTTEAAAPEPEPTTVIVSPLPAASPTSTSEPITPAPTPSSSPAPSSNGGETPGSACATEGLWNCVTKSTFQQCASGSWSIIQSLAAGMECEVGQNMVFRVGAVAKP
ncbi:hypothetical protein B0O99DRAFT_626495 [Bisporella sp. PMI_857]|nr:hypothetical protein B0O99DRAFT_626495 [Bisporella sp. PMI_857]